MGLGGRELAGTMQCQVEEHNDWDWNSAYWRNLAFAVGRRACHGGGCGAVPALLCRAHAGGAEAGHGCRHDHRSESRTEYAVGNRLDAARPGQTLVAAYFRAQRIHRDLGLDGSGEGRQLCAAHNEACGSFEQGALIPGFGRDFRGNVAATQSEAPTSDRFGRRGARASIRRARRRRSAPPTSRRRSRHRPA